MSGPETISLITALVYPSLVKARTVPFHYTKRLIEGFFRAFGRFWRALVPRHQKKLSRLRLELSTKSVLYKTDFVDIVDKYVYPIGYRLFTLYPIGYSLFMARIESGNPACYKFLHFGTSQALKHGHN